MYTFTRRWARWAGQRSELLKAVELGADVVQAWSQYETEVRVSIELMTGLAQRADDITAIRNLDRDDLRQLESLTVTLRPSRDAWRKAVEKRGLEADALGQRFVPPPDPVDAEVEIRAWATNGLRLSVRGPDRTSVEGLAQRLGSTLGRSGSRVSRDALLPFIWLLVMIGLVGGGLVPRWLGLHVSPGFTQAEFVGVVIGLSVAGATAYVLFRAFPNIEVLDEGELSRTRRLRQVAVAAVSGLLVTLMASALYDALT
jgi:hypothetical protein